MQSAEHQGYLALKHDVEGKKALATMIYQCFQTLKLFGKEPESLESALPIFSMVLADYPFERIKDAFAFYLKTNSEFPAPADIVNIIERGNKPPFDKSMYLSICKKDADYRSRDDWQYMREYEYFMRTGEYKSLPCTYRKNVGVL